MDDSEEETLEGSKNVAYYLWNALSLSEKLYVQYRNKQRLTNTRFICEEVDTYTRLRTRKNG